MNDRDGIFSDLPPLRDVIERYNIRPKKSLGQNFLLDLNLTYKIARTGAPLEGQVVLEIGAGPGGLTRALLAGGARHVIAVETDRRCVAALEELAALAGGRLTLVEADALKLDEYSLSPRPSQIVANLPYKISTPLLFKWLDRLDLFQHMTLMFQKEVAERIVAQPGSKAYGRLSVMVQWLCIASSSFELPAQAFIPVPKVNSTVLTLKSRSAPLAPAQKETLEAVVAATFGQRRKMLRRSLKQITDQPELLLRLVNLDPTLRPDALSITQFCALAEALVQPNAN